MMDKKLNVRIPADLDAALEHACTDRDLTKRAAVMQALAAWLQGAIPSDVGHPPDMSQNSAGVPSANGPSPKVSPDEDLVRQILDEYEARVLERVEAAVKGRQSGHTPSAKRKAGRG